MTAAFDYWGMLAGIALFLFAMSQLEAALKVLGGRQLAVSLREHTGNRITAVAIGIVATVILQSSSVVGLMVLAFTGAGLLSLTSALGIVFGSNLGTTLKGWIVATVGFKLEILNLALPLIAVGSLVYLFVRGRWSEYGRAVLSIGLLLLGLQFMKTSVASLQDAVDMARFAALAPWQFLIFGTIVAAVIQSSSATMMITLAALDAGIVSLPSAAAIAIGADLGTTTTVLLGAVGGSTTKKQVAAGHFLFNVITDLLAFILRVPLLGLIAGLGIDEPLYALVAFHSLFNLLGLFIFIPLTGPFATLLERLIPRRETREAQYLGEVSQGVSEAAVEAAGRETSRLISRVVRLTINAFEPPLKTPAEQKFDPRQPAAPVSDKRAFDDLYRATKLLEGELLEFTIRLQANSLHPDDSTRLSQCLNAAREAMHSAKALKDIRHNLHEFRESELPATERYLATFRSDSQALLDEVRSLHNGEGTNVGFEDLALALQNVRKRHDKNHESIYADVREDRIPESIVSSLLNVNRELLISQRALLLALAFYYLSPERCEDFERLPF